MKLLAAVVLLGLGLVGVYAQSSKQSNPVVSVQGILAGKNPGSPGSKPFEANTKRSLSSKQRTIPVDRKDFVFTLDRGDGLKTRDIVMKWIPMGMSSTEFQMGSTEETDPDRFPDETPHLVTLSSGFWLMETEATEEMYHAVMGINPSGSSRPDHPVMMVSWNDATNFCWNIKNNSLLKQSFDLTGFEFRLPTEAEWECACRAGSRTAEYLYTGNRKTELNIIAWWDWNSRKTTQPVRQKTPNVWGLYDMIGNVWEWCSDWYGDYPTTVVKNPVGPASGSERVFRGGGWRSMEWDARSARRDKYAPDGRFNDIGFRPALSRIR